MELLQFQCRAIDTFAMTSLAFKFDAIASVDHRRFAMRVADCEPGRPFECMSVAVEVEKERVIDENGQTIDKVGFRVGGGIDQSIEKTPYEDRVCLLDNKDVLNSNAMNLGYLHNFY